MIDSLAENFKMRFSDFHSHATNISIFENPFSIEVNDTPEKLQVEMVELQYHSILHSSFKQEASIAVCAPLPVSQFPELAQHLASVFGSTYKCEHALSYIKQTKLKFCSRITKVYLHDVIQTGISEMEPNINSLLKQRQTQISN
jgi:hypothetical protein